MSLKIKNERIIGTIDNLEEKLEGKLPVDRLELFYLINSWGRTSFFYTEYLNKDVKIEKCEPNYYYNLSKLDVSQITNMDSIFEHSNYSGDISKWNVSNVTSMFNMFTFNREFNSPLNDWDVSNVIDMSYMFWDAISFDQDISSWNLENVVICNYMFDKAKSFINKYNNGNSLPDYTNEIKEWFNLNRDKMNEIDIKKTHGKKIDDFFSIITDIHSRNEIGLHEKESKKIQEKDI